LAQGSVLGFSHPRKGAIVNAANEECLGGGGVDGAITDAGGENLHRDRLALPVLQRRDSCEIRCPTGSAVLTGPGSYDSLGVDHVIHAVGPNYFEFEDGELEKADVLLRSAYMSSLGLAKEVGLECVAFSLLSAGVYRGKRSVKDVLRIGVESICSFCGYDALQEIHMCAYNPVEASTLLNIATEMGLKP